MLRGDGTGTAGAVANGCVRWEIGAGLPPGGVRMDVPVSGLTTGGIGALSKRLIAFVISSADWNRRVRYFSTPFVPKAETDLAAPAGRAGAGGNRRFNAPLARSELQRGYLVI